MSGDGPLLHLALAGDWEAAQGAGEYRVSTRGLTLDQQGFIHLSFPHQLAGVAEAFYRDAGPLLVLEIDPALVGAHVVVEPGTGAADGELFPHLYGALPVAAVTRVRAAGFDRDGRFRTSGADA